jgi:molecular chaperone GrpE (heat shock protein)
MKDIARIPSPEEYGEHIARLNAESMEAKKRLERLEENFQQLRGDVQLLASNQVKTQTLVETIFPRLDGFENRILTIFGQMTQDTAKLLQSMTRQSSQTTQGWQKTVIEIIKYTVAALIGYALTKGGGVL